MNSIKYMLNINLFKVRKPLIPIVHFKLFCNLPEVDSNLPQSDLSNPFEKEKELCLLCKHNITPNYKNVRLLSQFQSPYTGQVYGKHITGLCSTKQKILEQEIIKAQGVGLMPYYYKSEIYLKDPKLFDPEKPVRPHRF